MTLFHPAAASRLWRKPLPRLPHRQIHSTLCQKMEQGAFQECLEHATAMIEIFPHTLTLPRPGEKEVPRDAHLYLYKIDAIARMMLPEEMASSASKNLLDRMLADLDPPTKRR